MKLERLKPQALSRLQQKTKYEEKKSRKFLLDP